METLEILKASNNEQNLKTKKRGNQYIYWCFTLPVINDLFDDELEIMETGFVEKLLRENTEQYIVQMECSETDYLHFQGWFKMKKKARITELKKFMPNRAHLSESKSAAAERYAMKCDTRIQGPFTYPYRYSGEDIITQLYSWQQVIVDKALERPDNRSINWWWGPKGNIGKSALVKYLVWHHGAIELGGKANDIYFGITSSKVQRIPIYIIDLARTREQYVPYEAMEKAKNGCFFSGKYESCQYVGPIPHIFVFANFEPNKETMSSDRWNIVNVEEL